MTSKSANSLRPGPYVWTLASILALTFLAFGRGGPDPSLTIAVNPSSPLIEVRDSEQFLNFDFAITNHGQSTLRLTEIEVSIYSPHKELVLRKTVNSNGLSPGINIVAKPLIAAGETLDIFNPFYSFPESLQIGHLDYAFRYVRENNDAEREANRRRLPMDFDVEAKASVRLKKFLPKTDLILPLRGRLMVWEGHDFYAHHRRVPLNDSKVLQMGIRANSNRYALDFEIVDKDGSMYRGDPYDKNNWYCYGAFLYAPGAGRIIASENGIPDNAFGGKRIVRPEVLANTDPKDLGNYVLIDHGNGEFSLLLHLMPGSLLVGTGEAVRQGQRIGRIGFSGDTIFPHLHYSLLSGREVFEDEGIPAYFRNYRRLFGSRSIRIANGAIDSGDFVESEASYGKPQANRSSSPVTPVP